MMDAGKIAVLQIVATVMLNLCLAGMVGVQASKIYLERSASASLWTHTLDRPLAFAWNGAILLAMLASALTLWLEATSMADVSIRDAWPAVCSVLEETHYGHVWLCGAGALLAAKLSTARIMGGQRRVWGRLTAVMSLASFVLSRALVSHAVVNGDISWWVAVDWIHLALISLWVGEVLVAGLVVLPQPIGHATVERRAAARYINVLSTSATWALSGIFLTGLLNALRGIGNVGNLVGNQYSELLLVKLALVALAAALGGLNRWWIMPQFLAALHGVEPGFAQPQRHFAQILKWEAIVLVGVMTVAAILSATAPPAAVTVAG